MGVRYLNRFLHRYPAQLLEDIDVGDETLVIDGSELLYQLYFNWGNLDTRCGGEYSELRQITIEFFRTLRQCNIKYFVIFDSFKSQNNVARFLRTRGDKLAAVRQLVERGQADRQIHPQMGKDVLKQTLLDEEVPFIVAPGDGDATISAVANELNAFVLANDTDFCIYGLTKGFLLMDDFEWQNIRAEDTHCRGKLFRRDVLHTTFGTPLPSIPFLEPLLSNQDGISGVDFTPFLRSLSREVRIPANLPRSDGRRPDFILNILLWLKDNYTGDDETIRLIKRNMSELPEKEFRNCLHVYNVLPDVTEEIGRLRSGKSDGDIGPPCFSHAEGLPMPADFLSIVPDDQSQPSAHKASWEIRKAVYQIGFSRSSLFQGADPKIILEADRDGHEYRSKILSIDVNEDIIQPLRLNLADRELAQSEDFEDIMDARRSFFNQSVRSNVAVETLGGMNELLAISLKFWNSLEDATPPHEIRTAMAITITCLHHDLNPSDLFQVDDNAFDIAALHSSMRWQVCITEMMRLNSILGHPFVNPSIGRVFSGKLLQQAYRFVSDERGISVNEVSSRLFGENRDAQRFFDMISRVINS